MQESLPEGFNIVHLASLTSWVFLRYLPSPFMYHPTNHKEVDKVGTEVNEGFLTQQIEEEDKM